MQQKCAESEQMVRYVDHGKVLKQLMVHARTNLYILEYTKRLQYNNNVYDSWGICSFTLSRFNTVESAIFNRNT